MSPEAQRIAIAEACGFTVVENTLCNVIPDRLGDPELEPIAPLPDYLSDLNAMHEAENTLTAPQSERYAEFLLDVLTLPSPFIGTARCAFLTGHATAAQRAESFLRTIGKWEDGK